MSGFVNEFKKFILRGNVIDLAIGVVIGAAFAKIVESLVIDILMPIIEMLSGGSHVAGQEVVLYKDAVLRWGNFLQTVIHFFTIGFCLFLIVKGVNVLHHRLLKEAAAKPPELSASEKLLAEIRDLLKQSNPNGPLPTA